MEESIALEELLQEGKDITTHLMNSEKVRLEICEGIIKKGLNTFLEVGHALADIRDNRLYRETHKSFEKYCKDVWDLSKGYANKQIGGYETVRLLESKMAPIGAKNNKMVPIGTKNDDTGMSAITDEKWNCYDQCMSCEHRKALANRAFKGIKIPGAPGKCTRPGGLCEKVLVAEEPDTGQEVILPINEAQTRPLTKLKNPDDQVEAWRIVLEQLSEGKKLTAALINKAVKQVRSEVKIRKIDATNKKVNSTELVSLLFKKQYKIMTEIIYNEQNSGWEMTSRKEAVKWLKLLVKLAETDD